MEEDNELVERLKGAFHCFLKVGEENGIVEKFDWAVEGILLPLVCLVGVFGKNIS